MNEAGQDWARRGAAADEDPALRAFAAGGALLLWDTEHSRFGHANPAGTALLGGELQASPLPTARRLDLLARGLASTDGLRLERLRLKASFSAVPLVCGCKLVAIPGASPVLGVAIPASELRRLGVQAPAKAASDLAASAAEPRAAQLVAHPPASTQQEPRPATIRFVWQSDAEGRLTRMADTVEMLGGPGAAAALIGRSWTDLIGTTLIDRDGGLAERFATAATWSGHVVLWRLHGTDSAAPVELSAVPIFGAERQPAGFRGFGLARLSDSMPLPQPDAAELPQEVVVAAPPLPDADPSQQAAAGDVAAAPLEQASDEVSSPALPEAEPAPVVDGTPDILPQPADDAEPDAAATAEAAEPAGEDDATEMAGAEDEATGDEDGPESAPEPPAAATEPAPGNIFPLRQGSLAIRPVLEPSKTNLSSAERNAFREIAKALGARLADDGATTEPRLPPVAPLRVKEREGIDEPAAKAETVAMAAPPVRQRNAHADLLDRLPVAVLVNRGEDALYANRTLLDLLDYADLDDLKAGGGVSRLIKDAERSGGGAMTLIDRGQHLVRVEAVISSVDWLDEPATLMAFRHPDGGGEVPVLTPEEAEEAELAAEFEAEQAESAARVEALRLDAEVRDERIAELTAMLDTATDGVVTVDDRGRILSLNKAAEALFGYDQREVTGELLTLLFANESHAPALDYLEGLKGGGVASLLNDGREVAGRVRQGGKIPLFMTMGQIAHGEEPRFCAVLRDITAWKKTEGELVDARKAAELASAQKSDVLAKISHEIRTPLNAIIGFAEVMAEERFGPIGNERYKEYLRDIHQSGGYVISLVNDLLDLAKIEAGKLDLDFVSVNLNDIALSTVALLQPEAQRAKVVLRSGLSPKLPPVVADERSIRQIAINLLSNAVKFTDAGGQVIISTALGDQGEAILRVRDTGIGMDDDELKLALEPFRQVPTTRRSGGTGLGLPLTKALVEANRAAMAITSVKKEGTLVEVTFPPQRVLAS
ncbi:ATP-binding protein [Bosea sp. (in: a-proteobacteria)]|uniref:sensor histidine kinase n=1 Tax=Bosea sp. (in: a-proteobacteria) TaxID=1871050 RepID=UPI003B3BD5BC